MQGVFDPAGIEDRGLSGGPQRASATKLAQRGRREPEKVNYRRKSREVDLPNFCS